MMNSDYGTMAWEGNPVGYSTVETLLNEAASHINRYSRAPQRIERPTGGSMRIVKPSSTSNSPRGAMGLGRRKTVMSDRRRMVVDHASGTFVSYDGLQHPAKSNRPVSWHPSSHLQPQQMHQSPNAVFNYNINNECNVFELPPTPTVYSGYGSPSSTFSPLSAPYTGYEQQQQQFQYPNSSAYPLNCNFSAYQQSIPCQPVPQYLATPVEPSEPSMCSQYEWNNFAANGFGRSTAPPTPENFLPSQHIEPTFPAEESIPYHPLSDAAEEEEGEILCGLGLYDTPEVLKSAPSDPHLNNYRSAVMSQYIGSPYRKETSGKGLKLEETWNPPDSDDEDDQDDDEADGEGEDDDEEVQAKNVAVVASQVEVTHRMPPRSQSFDNLTWL